MQTVIGAGAFTPREMTAKECAEFERLTEEYKGATLAVSKSLHVDNPPEPGQVVLFVEAAEKAATIVARLRELLGAT